MKHISATALVIAASPFFATLGPGQNSPAQPIYRITVIGRTIRAVNYQYRSGPTRVDFRGTVLLPQSKGHAVVESKAGRTEVDARLEHLAPSQQFGNEYLTYVLWAVTPQGHSRNLGEVLVDGGGKAHTRVTTDLQTFGLIVTAEPYAEVGVPSDVVVIENQVRPDTMGGSEPIQVRYELMPRGTYTWNVPSGPSSGAPKISMSEYEKTVHVYQALNALRIAKAQEADRYAPSVFAKAQRQYEYARRLQADGMARNTVVTSAREAAQSAEDARALAVARRHEAELATARGDARREEQLRLQAEADRQRALSDASAARDEAASAARALESERSARRVAEARAAAPPPPPVVERRAIIRNGADPARVALRSQLLTQLNGQFRAIDSGRGLIVTVPDSDFRGTALMPSPASDLARIASVVLSQPRLMVDVEGNSDAPGASAESFSLERAFAVRDALSRAGLPANRIQARGLANQHPFGPNGTAQGREENRRVEIIIHGDPIGDTPGWEKTYSLRLR